MNIVGFSGSPRKAGSTAVAVGKVLEGAREQSANTQMFSAGELEIKPCQACQGCAKGGGCIIKDDMQAVYAALKTADALILGAPIYMGQMSAQAKTLTDRLYAHFRYRKIPAARFLAPFCRSLCGKMMKGALFADVSGRIRREEVSSCLYAGQPGQREVSGVS